MFCGINAVGVVGVGVVGGLNFGLNSGAFILNLNDDDFVVITEEVSERSVTETLSPSSCCTPVSFCSSPLVDGDSSFFWGTVFEASTTSFSTIGGVDSAVVPFVATRELGGPRFQALPDFP